MSNIAAMPDAAGASLKTSYRPAFGVAVFTVSQVVALGLSFVGGALMVRTAPRAMVASYVLLLQAVMSLTLLLQLGLAPATLRFAPLARGRGGRHATAHLRMRLAGVLLSTWCVVAVPLFLLWPRIATRLDAPELATASAVIFGAAALIAFNQVVDAYLRSFRRYVATALAGEILPRTVTSIGFVVLFLIHRPVDWTTLTAVFFVGHIVSGLAYAWALRSSTTEEDSEQRVAAPVPDLRTLLGTALTMGLRSGTSMLMAASAVWVLSWARPHEEVAVFGMMVSLLQVVGLVPTGVARVVTQEFATLHADGRRQELERLIRSCATAMAALSLGTLLLLGIFGRELIRIAYGSSYVSGWAILMILAVGTFVDSAFGLAGYLLQMTGYHRRLLFLTVLAAVTNIVLSISLVQRYGGLGVATANATSLIVFNIGMASSVHRRLGIRTVAYLNAGEWRAMTLDGLRILRTNSSRWFKRRSP